MSEPRARAWIIAFCVIVTVLMIVSAIGYMTGRWEEKKEGKDESRFGVLGVVALECATAG